MSEQRREYKIAGRPSTIYRVVKNKDNPFVMIDRRPVDNPALSFKSKGILTYLLSRPDGWEVSVADLIKHGTDGEAAIRSGLKELKNAGHMKYTVSRKEGRITGWLIEVHEVPDRDFQQVENQDVENRGQVLSKRINKQKKQDNTKAATPKPETPAEVKLYREVTKKYPNSVNFEDVVKAVQAGAKRLLRPVVADDLKPFYKEWTGRGYNQYSIKWLEWFETGSIPSKGKPQTNPLPRGVQVAQSWLLRKQQEQNG